MSKKACFSGFRICLFMVNSLEESISMKSKKLHFSQHNWIFHPKLISLLRLANTCVLSCFGTSKWIAGYVFQVTKTEVSSLSVVKSDSPAPPGLSKSASSNSLSCLQPCLKESSPLKIPASPKTKTKMSVKFEVSESEEPKVVVKTDTKSERSSR